jgi:phosphomannomutase
VKNGLEINFEKECVYLRKSNNEPIIRIYTESISQNGADQLAIDCPQLPIN